MRVRLLTASVVGVLLIGVLTVVTATLVSIGRLDDVGYPDSSTLLIGSWTTLTNFTYASPLNVLDTSAAGQPHRFYRSISP